MTMKKTPNSKTGKEKVNVEEGWCKGKGKETS